MKKLLKALTVLTLGTSLFISSIPVEAQVQKPTKYFYDGSWHVYTRDPVKLFVKSEALTGDMPPIIFNNYTLVPARLVFEKLGASVSWNESKKRVGVVMGDKNISLDINKQNALVNGSTYKMPIAPKIINNRTMIPTRFVAETLGLKVEWIARTRTVLVDRPGEGNAVIKDASSTTIGSATRLKISSNDAIADYSTHEYNDPPRLAIDINNAVLSWQGSGMAVNSGSLKSVRASQYEVNPNITRIVADLNNWTGYKLSLSNDKKELYVDFDNKPAEIEAVNFSNSGDTDVVSISTKNGGKYDILPSDGSGKVNINIPMTSLGKIKSSIQTAGCKYVKTIECSQADTNTVRLSITAGNALMEASSVDGGIKLTFSDSGSRFVFYSNNPSPKLILQNDRIAINYFNYRETTEGNKLKVAIPSGYFDIKSARLIVNDNSIDCVDILKDSESNCVNFTVTPKIKLDYNVTSVDNSNQIIINASPSKNVVSDRGDGRVDPAILGKVVVIDPGHGGSESGAVYPDKNPQAIEKNLNLDIATRLYNLLKNAGINAYITRTDDSYVGLNERSDMANKLNADLFVSVHNNSGDSWERGTMTLYYPSNYNHSFGITSERVAQILQNEMIGTLGTLNRGIWKRPNLAVLNSSKMPAVLAEVSYISDSSDRQNLLSESFRNKAAAALCTGILKALSEMTANQKDHSEISNPSVYQAIYSTQPTTVNGFIIPANAVCDYRWGSTQTPSIFDLGIQLDYSKQVSGKATLDQQKEEARKVLSSKLEAAAVDKIMSYLSDFNGVDTHIWQDELSSSSYNIWVKAPKESGKATVELIHK